MKRALWFVISGVGLAISAHAEKTERILIVDASRSPYSDLCRRHLESSPEIKICLTGNGRYSLSTIEDFFAKANWFKDKPFVRSQIDTVSFVCKDLAGKKPQFVRIALPDFAESRKGERARVEIPCDMPKDEVIRQMRIVTQFLSDAQTRPNELVNHFDQTRTACEGTKVTAASKHACQKLRTHIGRVLSLETKNEEIPALTIGGLQIVSGLKQAPPEVMVRRAEPDTKANFQLSPYDLERKLNQELTKDLPDCGLSMYERMSDESLNSWSQPLAASMANSSALMTDTTKISWSKCIQEIRRQRKELERQGVVFDRNGGFTVDGKIINFFGPDIDPRARKAWALTSRELTTKNDLVTDLLSKGRPPGSHSQWKDALKDSSYHDSIVCDGGIPGGFNVMGNLSQNTGSSDEIEARARSLYISAQLMVALRDEFPGQCAKVISSQVISPGKIVFEFEAAGNPYGQTGSGNPSKTSDPTASGDLAQ